MSYRPQARRAADEITFTNITTSFSASAEVQLDAASVDLDSFVLDGYTLERTGGAEAALTVTVRFFDASSGNCVYEDTVTVDATGDTAGAIGLGMPLNRSGATGIFYQLKASAGSDTDGTLLVYLAPLVV